MPDLIRFALGSGLRIGEICAVRWMDLDLDGIPAASETDMRLVPVVAVRQNVYPVSGKGLVVHGGKTSMALRIVPLPQFVVTQLRARHHADDDPSESCLSRWLKIADREDGITSSAIDRPPKPGKSDLEAENRELRKRAKQLEQENEILRRATAYFARDVLPK
jgi:integrase